MSKKSAKSGDRLTRTYQLKVLQLRALHPPDSTATFDDHDAPTPGGSSSVRKRSAPSSGFELAPPKKRQFSKVNFASDFDERDVSLDDGNKSEFYICLTSAQNSLISPTSPAVPSNASGSTGSPPAPHAQAPSSTTRKDKGKGKGKAKDQDVHMD